MDGGSGAGLRRLVGRLVLAATAVALTIAMAELGARVLVPAWTPKNGARNYWRYDERLGWVHQQKVDATHAHRDFEVRLKTNAHGFRDDPIAVERTPGRKRMLLLGDSFAFGYGVEQDEALSEILEARHPEWEVVNTAVAGWGTDQQLLFYRDRGRAFSPDVVLLMFHPNDLADNAGRMRYGYYKPHFVLEQDELVLTGTPVRELSREQKIDRYLNQRTFFLTRLWEIPDRIEDWLERPAPEPKIRLASLGDPPAVSAGPPQDVERNGGVVLTRRLVRELADEVAASGARFAVVSVPGPDRRSQETLAPLLAELGVPYLALDEAFATWPRDSIKFAHDPHWNPKGQVVAADATEQFLLMEGILP